MPTGADYAARAKSHIGQFGPVNTCMSNGTEKWAREIGIKTLETNSTSVGRLKAKRGFNGYQYSETMDGVAVGDILDWAAPLYHFSVCTDIDGNGNIRSVGSGTPTQRVSFQPSGGGYSPTSQYRGFIRPPFNGAPVTNTDSGNPITDAIGNVTAPWRDAQKAVSWITDRGNLTRVALFSLGFGLILIAGIMLIVKSKSGQAAIKTAKVATVAATTKNPTATAATAAS